MNSQKLTFGDTVKVRASEVTIAAELAGLTGSIHGETTPSITDVDVLGDLNEDYAVNVFFDDRELSVWIEPELLEFIDHGAGAEITLDGVDKKWTRQADGAWTEEDTVNAATKARPWWKFWKR